MVSLRNAWLSVKPGSYPLSAYMMHGSYTTYGRKTSPFYQTSVLHTSNSWDHLSGILWEFCSSGRFQVKFLINSWWFIWLLKGKQLCVFPPFSFKLWQSWLNFPLRFWEQNGKVTVISSWRWMALSSLSTASQSYLSGRLVEGSNTLKIIVPASCWCFF